jgi:hypothetical protein
VQRSTRLIACRPAWDRGGFDAAVPRRNEGGGTATGFLRRC